MSRVGHGWRTAVVLVAMSLLLSGCITARLKQLEIRQLETQLQGMKDTEAYLRTNPTLGSSYDARLFLRGDVFNRFLAGLDNYKVPLPSPRGAVLTVSHTELKFDDGPPQVTINASAVDRSGKIEVRVRIRADLIMVAYPEKGEIATRFEIREIVPDVRISIFRLRQLLFVGALLRLKGQELVDALPATTIPLKGDLPIALDPSPNSQIAMGNNGTLYVRQDLPHLSLSYHYRAERVITLADGIHVFFKLDRTS
ncbi:hypothetical protein [Mesorhizobium sp. M0977]|uniref:hypothetical protein n=1 Tax=unclassified Mesorhizobium TaxID=325217 RepID=UPI003334CB48